MKFLLWYRSSIFRVMAEWTGFQTGDDLLYSIFSLLWYNLFEVFLLLFFVGISISCLELMAMIKNDRSRMELSTNVKLTLMRQLLFSWPPYLIFILSLFFLYFLKKVNNLRLATSCLKEGVTFLFCCFLEEKVKYYSV